MTTTAKLSLETFLKQHETKPYREYDGGKVTRKAMPTLPHSIIESILGFVFITFLREHPLGIVGTELRCILRRGNRRWAPVPDFVFISHERLAGRPLRGPFQGPPDLAVEILSPDDRVADAIDKLRDYLANGVRLTWLFDPERRTVLVMTGPEQMRLFTENEMLDGGDVLPGFRVAVRDLLPPAADGASADRSHESDGEPAD